MLLDKLASGKLLVSVICYEFFNNHVSTANSNHQLSIHDLCKDSSSAEIVVSVSESLDRHLALHRIDVPCKLFIDGVTFEGTVNIGAVISCASSVLLSN